jgi:hypothetical protein
MRQCSIERELKDQLPHHFCSWLARSSVNFKLRIGSRDHSVLSGSLHEFADASLERSRLFRMATVIFINARCD